MGVFVSLHQMANSDYTYDELTITDMVFNRLRFLNREDSDNQELINQFVWEVMNELEPCFSVSKLPDGTIDATRIGQEQYYSVAMQSIIADIVTTYILMYQAAFNAQGDPSNDISPTTRFLKRSKAGTAEVEWGQFTTKDAVGLFMNTDGLIAMYKKSAASKARNLGCILDICDDCTAKLDGYIGIVPTLNVQSCGCGC